MLQRLRHTRSFSSVVNLFICLCGGADDDAAEVARYEATRAARPRRCLRIGEYQSECDTGSGIGCWEERGERAEEERGELAEGAGGPGVDLKVWRETRECGVEVVESVKSIYRSGK